ncbi:MAG: hypothetical protein KDE19_16170 [Caldilineaceae bacterium]|nr:hypothetical protein [Caldilineaceae bacterium]
MKQTPQTTPSPFPAERTATNPVGGLTVRTDLRAGLAWDDLDDKAQELWSNLTNTINNLTTGVNSGS